MTLTPGDAVADAFLALAGRVAGGRRLGTRRLAELIGVPLVQRPDESFASYQVFRGSGDFHGGSVTADLRAPRRRSAQTPLLLILELAEPLPLSTAWLRGQGTPDVTEPPSGHVDDAPEYVGFRRGNVLASIGVVHGQVTSLVLKVPG